MKAFKLLSLIAFLLISNATFCDLIPVGSHFVNVCVKISNVSDYSDVSLLGYVPGPIGIPTYIITSNNCLDKGYHLNTLNIFAVKNNYLTGKDITAIDWSKDNHAIKSSIPIDSYGGYIPDANPIQAIDKYYRILGFNDTSVVLYKWKEVNKFNNGRLDSIITFTYSGDSTILSQEMFTNIKSNPYSSTVKLYPNPAINSFHLNLSNDYFGPVSIKIISIDGKVLRSSVLDKTENSVVYHINADKLRKGVYFVKVVMGEAIESKKMVIK